MDVAKATTLTLLLAAMLHACGGAPLPAHDLTAPSSDASATGSRLLSPASIEATLAMLAAGAAGTTADEVTRTLGYPSVTAMNAAVGAQQRALATLTDPASQVTQGNRVWLQAGTIVLPAYTETLREVYAADVASVDFAAAPDQATASINGWIEEQTHGAVRGMVPAGAVDGGTRLVLTNALHLQAQWQRPFDSQLTADATFLTPRGSRLVKMMEQVGTFEYQETSSYQTLELPYAGKRLVMDVILPVGPITDTLTIHSAPQLARRIDGATRRLVRVKLPSFAFDAASSLAPELKAAGMQAAFGSDADFSGITGGGGLALSDVLHHASVSVTEKGTEAGASTAVLVYTSDRDPVDFIAVRPFIFLIRDVETGAVLLLGLYDGPA